MTGTIGEVSFFVALLVVILIHEAAHFGMAKRFGIKVEEFFVGFGPRIWSFRPGETEYGLKAIPAGGYVKIAGMNPYQEVRAEDVPRTFGAKPIWQRAVVIFAGPATHFVLAFLFFALWLGGIGEPKIPVIDQVAAKLDGLISPAASVGLQAGDRVVGVGPIADPGGDQFVQYTRDHVGQQVAVRIQRGDRIFTVRITPVMSEIQGVRVGRIGVILSLARDRAGPLGSITGGVRLMGSALVGTIDSLGRVFGPEGVSRVLRLLFTNAPRRPTDPASVVGIGRVVGQTAAAGNFGDILYLFGLVNVFIGLLNLLPLPPFDGGHLAVLVVEKARGRKVDMRKLAPISAVVAAYLILFTLSIVYLDIIKPISLRP